MGTARLEGNGLPDECPVYEDQNEAYEGFDPDTMTSNELMTLIQTTMLRAPEEDMFNVIVDFNKIGRRTFTTLNADVSALTKG